MDEDWELLLSLFPGDWRELAVSTKALKGLRKDKSEENLLRTLLIHLGCGYSLRETVVRAREAGLADLSDVALLKRLRKCQDWFYALCVSLFADRGLQFDADCFRVRLFDATHVKEPGQTGSLWRIHYSVELPSLKCDFFRLTPTEGEGNGESLLQFPVRPGDYIIADRGYSTARGFHYVASRKAHLSVRLNPQAVRLLDMRGRRFSLLDRIGGLRRAGCVGSWRVLVPYPESGDLEGQVCAVRKTREAIQIAHAKEKKRASKKGQALRPETLTYAEYVIVLSTFPRSEFSPAEILEWYRIRWQIELVFKRFKQLAALGHLPKHDEESAKAWLYGKFFVALVTEKLIECATTLSPWGYELAQPRTAKPLA